MEDAADRHRWHGLHVLILLGVVMAAPLPATLDAIVERDGRIHGTLTVPPGTAVTDVLAQLPSSDAMLHLLRTFPGREDVGEVRSTEVQPGVFSFETRLPARYGAIGHTRHGTFAHGGFYPQPLVEGLPPTDIDWDVTLTLPHTGMVNTAVGTGEVHWTGVADRVTLAVPKRARVWTLQAGAHRVVVVGKGRPRRFLWNNIARVLPSLAPQDVVLAEAPLRRRLFRAGVGSALVSDRIFRLTLPFQPFHVPALVEGLEAANSRQTHPQLREFVGWTRAQAWMQREQVGGAEGFTRFFTWVPSIDALLSSRRIAYYREIFREIDLGDPIEDDLFEVLAPHRTGAGLSVQVDDTWGPGTALRLTHALARNLSLPQAFQLEGLDPLRIAPWRAAIPPQDYVLTVDDRGASVRRDAPPDAPTETVVIAVDGAPSPYQLAPGEVRTFDRPGRIRIDPGAHVPQLSRSGDAWPVGKLRFTGTGWTDLVNLSRFRFVGGVDLTLRGRDDTHNRFSMSLSTERASLAQIELGYTYRFGPLIFGITRRHRLGIGIGAALVDPAFRSTEDGRISLSSNVGWSYANYGGSVFPVRGWGASLGTSGLMFPDGRTRRGSLTASVRGLTSPHPRHAFAGQIVGGLASATREDLLLTLGGPSRMRSFPVLAPCGAVSDVDCAPVATSYAIVAGEYRVAVVRGLSVPMGGVFWGSEIQASVGMEGVAATLIEGPGLGIGATAGISAAYDNWGVEPMLIGVTAGWPLWGWNLEPATPTGPRPELYLRFGQAL